MFLFYMSVTVHDRDERDSFCNAKCLQKVIYYTMFINPWNV